MRIIRLIGFFIFGLVLGGWSVWASASAMPLHLPSNVGGVPGSYVTGGPAVFDGAAFNSGLRATVGGKPYIAPAAWRLAANAPTSAVRIVRATPSLFIATVVLPWLLEYGIEWLNNQWSVRETGKTFDIGRCSTGISGVPYQYGVSLDVCVEYARAAIQAANPTYEIKFSTIYNVQYLRWTAQKSGGNLETWNVGSWIKSGTQTDPDTIRPATEDDWNKVTSITDPVSTVLAPHGLPLQNPKVNVQPQKLPLSDPYYDPVDKKWYRTVAIVTPAADGQTAQVEIAKQEVDPETKEDIVDNSGSPVTKEETDFCDLHPDSLACIQTGEAEDIDLEKRDVGQVITPVPIGAGSCPAPRVLSTRAGALTFSYQPICDFATLINPVVVALAWLLAGYILLGAVKNDG